MEQSLFLRIMLKNITLEEISNEIEINGLYHSYENDLSLFHFAIEHEKKDIIDLLLNKGYDIDTCTFRKPKFSCLHTCIKFNKFELLKYFIEEKNANITKETSLGRTPFHVACIYGFEDIYYYLLERVDLATLKKTDVFGMTPLKHLIYYKYVELGLYLVKKKNELEKK